MSLLSDVDIKRSMHSRDIVIEPFSDKNLTPVGYDVRVGSWVASLTTGTILPEERYRGAFNKTGYWVPAHERVLVISMETIRVSRRVGGTFHTMVALAARGLSPIATTLDPGWSGVLFIALTNLADHPIFLEKGEPLTTLVFYQVNRKASAQNLNDKDLNDTHKLEQIIERLAREAGLSDELSDALLSAQHTVEEIKEAAQNQSIVTGKKAAADRWRALRWVAGTAMAIGLVVLAALTIFTTNADQRSTYEVALISALISLALVVAFLRREG